VVFRNCLIAWISSARAGRRSPERIAKPVFDDPTAFFLRGMETLGTLQHRFSGPAFLLLGAAFCLDQFPRRGRAKLRLSHGAVRHSFFLHRSDQRLACSVGARWSRGARCTHRHRSLGVRNRGCRGMLQKMDALRLVRSVRSGKMDPSFQYGLERILGRGGRLFENGARPFVLRLVASPCRSQARKN
jgi:hypothetical protein